jgi:tetratricopeptide (TPR) repeat protein
MNLYLFLIPGALFLLVIFFRVGLPYLKNPAWKHAIDNARYYRHREKPEKSDSLLEKAIEKYPDRPEVYAEYFLNHSDSANLQKRLEVLMTGYDRTGDTVLAFFIGNGYFENGDFSEARKYLNTDACREYMIHHRIPLFAQLLYEENRYDEAEKEFIAFYNTVFHDSDEGEKVLEDLSAQELALYVLILKAGKKEWRRIMGLVPRTSVHSDMGWKDYLDLLRDEFRELRPAVTGISGDPSEFNRRRAAFYKERIKLVEAYLQQSARGVRGKG